MKLQKNWRKLSIITISATIFLSSWTVGTVTYAAAEPVVTTVSEEPLTSGAILKKYVWQTTRSGKAVKTNANVVEVDLTNPYVKIDVMTGTNNQFTKKQSVLAMAKETKAVAGTNGDFFNTKAEGVPMGAQIGNGQLMATPMLNSPGWYTFALDKNNKPIVDAFTFQGSIIAKDGASYPLGGINKTYYWYGPNDTHSHIDGLFMYTNTWGQVDRSNDGVTYPTEVLVQNGVIKQVADNGIIQMIAPQDGYILRAAGKAADFVRTHMKAGDPLQADYKMLPQDASKNYDVSSFKMMIGGHTLLVDGGQPSIFTLDLTGLGGYRARTALGYSQDEKKAFIITADASGDSKGLSMTELQQFMVKIGVWKGLNLDGGGSTQMVARPLGETSPVLINQTEGGGQRQVVNGVGVYTLAPKGAVKGMTIQAPLFLFIGEDAPLSFRGYDEYYNPIEVGSATATWSTSSKLGTFKDNIFTPSGAGLAKVSAVAGSGTASEDLEIVGRNQLTGLTIHADRAVISEGASVKLPVIALTSAGESREVPPALIQWEVLGVKGEVVDGVLKVSSLNGQTAAEVIAKYDGYSTMAVIPLGQDKVWYDLDKNAVETFSDAKPLGVTSDVYIRPDEKNNKYLALQYDFSGGGTEVDKWAFATLDTRILIEGKPEQMKMKVNGDESLNWLRAELLDNKGKVHRVDIARNINWKGWKELTVNLGDYPAIDYPIRVQSVYLVNEGVGQDERAEKGQVGIDDITFTYRGSLPSASNNTVGLTVGNKAVSVNGKGMTLEQAPVIVEGNTLIPLRFVTDALGGTVRWDEKERKVTVIRNGKMIDLWIGNKDLIVNGERITAEVPPVIMSDLTMVPLRILSENLGWKVTWDGNTRQITLQ
ncbi:stalk domain-containing protein [Paenibacillus caseinilyticus]|uniref:stalk domain-containing protein n=1 Tax=Paenibacillus caseinilyticus TaxID=3098138 RepID=UPI0022B89913|nr:stalk domain-containing protein [Paenibacillus caseinilyticus]MCZ8523321.1 stalk domain-containing protein [Paenibacillus caseinilyticus]